MDRIIVYPGAIPLDTDMLSTNRNTMKALGMLIQAVLGSNTVVSGLTVGPNSPNAMNVVVAPGSIFQLSTVDATAYGSLAADTADALMKQGINIASTTLAVTAPSTSGFSQNYLIEASLLEADGTPVVLPYYNAANPASPYVGPNNSGTSQNTVRAQTVQLQAKAGVAATTGTQTTPAVDAGWVPLAVVTVAYGQVSVASGNIVASGAAPIIPYTLPNIVPGFSNQVTYPNAGTFTWTVPALITRARVRVWAAGGGGAGSTGTNAGGGGGAGGYAEMIVTGLTPGANHTVTVGTGGTGGTSGGGSGGNGGNSSFDSTVVATGGMAGEGSGGGLPYSGGVAGAGTAGTVLMTGGHGNGGGSPSMPMGGASPMGGAGGAASNGEGSPGAFPGGGGAGWGANTTGAGQAGAGGLVIVEY